MQLAVLLYDIVKKCQAPALAAQRAVTDAGKVRVAVKAVLVEHRHDSQVLHVAISHNGIKDIAAMRLHIGIAVPGDGLQKL